MVSEIEQTRPDTAEALALIKELDDYLIPLSPPESRHGYSVDKLIEQKVQFFVLRHDGEPAGCGGIQFFEPEDEPPYAELKRMYVRPAFRGLGLAQAMLSHLEKETAERGVKLMRLETGIAQQDAVRLYERWGFTQIPPFGSYQLDPNSLYYEKEVA